MRWWRSSALRRWIVAHPLTTDAAIAAVLVVVSLANHLTQFESEFQQFHDPTWWTVLLTVATCLPLTTRRRFPEASALVVIVLQSLAELAEINGTSWMPSVIAIYSLGAYGTGRRRTRAALISAVITAALLVAGMFHYEDVPLMTVTLVSAGAILIAAYLFGDVVKRRRLEVKELAARVERAERERELLAAQRVGEERARIARELHDVVAHSVSVMVIQATAARRNLERDPAALGDLLDNITGTGRQAMSELRQILGVLRTEATAEPEYAPLLVDLDALGRSFPDLDVDVRCTGSWEQVPSSVALQVYRVLQEALTNAHRHAGPGTHVDVDVEIEPHQVELRVADDGRGASAAVGSDRGGGYGLVGMRERAAAFNGSLRAGPRRSGGWEVSAIIPIRNEYAIAPTPDVMIVPG